MATLQDLLTKCANCAVTFDCEAERVTAIVVNKVVIRAEKEPVINPVGVPEEQLHKEEQEELTLNYDTHHPHHHHQVSLSLVDVDSGEQHLSQELQDQLASEGHRLIEINIIESDQQDQDKKPYLVALNPDPAAGDNPRLDVDTQEILDEGADPLNADLGVVNPDEVVPNSNDAAEGELSTVTILEALSFIFEIPLESLKLENESGFWSKDDPCAFCIKCAQALRELYNTFQEFNQLTQEASYVSKGVRQFQEKINILSYEHSNSEEATVGAAVQSSSTFLHPEVTITEREGNVETNVGVAASSSTGRRNASRKAKEQKKSLRIRRKQESPKKVKDEEGGGVVGVAEDPMMEVDESESDDDLIFSNEADRLSEVSSDSNSFSDLEKTIKTPPPEQRKTRVSTRPRTAKKQLSDYEEMETSEDEPDEIFEDDEEEDPNFDAEEELQDLKVKQETDRLKQLTDICAEEVEYKEEDLKTDEEGKFICPDADCNKSFKGIKTLNKHAVTHKLTQTPLCPKCNKEFESLEELHRHLKTNHAISKIHKRSPGRPPKRKKPGRPKRKGGIDSSKGNQGLKREIKKECPTCGEEFFTQRSLERHEIQEHNPLDKSQGQSESDTGIGEGQNGPVECDVCGRQFATLFFLKRHKKDVHEKTELDYSCPECGELLTDLESLTEHFEQSHEAKLNFCLQCGKTFIQRAYLNLHLSQTHKIDVGVVVVQTVGSVKLEPGLSEPTLHLEAVTTEEISQAVEAEQHENDQIETEMILPDLENLPFESDDPLLEPGERKRKADPTPFKCPHCEKEYKRKKQLDVHLLFHNGEEPQYECNVCTKRFFQPRSLKRHMVLHTTDNPHVCHVCERVFPRAENLKRHMEASHSDEKSRSPRKAKKDNNKDPVEHKCSECEKVFTRKEYLRLHQRIHTGEKPFMCQDCGKTFRDPRNLAQHLVTHKTERPFCCSICGLTFKRAHHLNDHEGTHREDVARPFVCTLPNCGKAFKLKKHLISHELVHSGTKDHQCEICGKAFNRKDNLRQHVNKVHGKDSFSDLIRVGPADCLISGAIGGTPLQNVQIQLQGQGLPTLQGQGGLQQIQVQVQSPPITTITMTQTGNSITMTIPPHAFQQQIQTPHFTYTHL